MGEVYRHAVRRPSRDGSASADRPAFIFGHLASAHIFMHVHSRPGPFDIEIVRGADLTALDQRCRTKSAEKKESPAQAGPL
jgi:hypothetical protein